MSLDRLHPENPVETLEVPQTVTYNWEYDATRRRLSRLYENAKRDHFDFIQKMRDRGVEVVEMHNLLAETVAVPEGKKWILDNQVVPNQVGLGFIDELRSYLEGLGDLAGIVIG